MENSLSYSLKTNLTLRITTQKLQINPNVE